MYTLYWGTRTGAFIPDAILAEMGQPITRIKVKRTDGRVDDPAFEAISPMKQIPVLLFPDGSAVSESLAIALALVERLLDPPLLPPVGSSARAEAYRWLMHMYFNVYESDLRYSYADRYTTASDGVEGVKAAAVERWDRAFAVIEEAASDEEWFSGHQFSLIDICIAPMVCWHYDTEGLLARHPKLAEICKRVRDRPALKPLFTLYRLPELDGL
ncbi:MAG: glutathione S-transferase family protein [Desulfobacterales bacterium]|nr:glutathione S-transferase family protein [Desulfobacterales bacterium]